MLIQSSSYKILKRLQKKCQRAVKFQRKILKNRCLFIFFFVWCYKYSSSNVINWHSTGFYFFLLCCKGPAMWLFFFDNKKKKKGDNFWKTFFSGKIELHFFFYRNIHFWSTGDVISNLCKNYICLSYIW